ncbi:MAG: hypothetical protein MGU50_22630 [Trichodesmium sp. MAG_R02]|jgi:hypothetical protein|nr:hypothetical protein [Trichodesmium sp. MAG_R02]
MSKENIATFVKNLESFSDEQQDIIIENLREYITENGNSCYSEISLLRKPKLI